MYLTLMFLTALLLPTPVIAGLMRRRMSPYRVVVEGAIAGVAGALFVMILASAAGESIAAVFQESIRYIAQTLAGDPNIAQLLGDELTMSERVEILTRIYGPVSYTHLDVYKRQYMACTFASSVSFTCCANTFAAKNPPAIVAHKSRNRNKSMIRRTRKPFFDFRFFFTDSIKTILSQLLITLWITFDEIREVRTVCLKVYYIFLKRI